MIFQCKKIFNRVQIKISLSFQASKFYNSKREKNVSMILIVMEGA